MDIVTYKMAQKYTDTAIQSHQDISGKEDKENKVTSIDNTSTDTQYPSAKCLYDSQSTQDDEIEALQAENERLRNTLSTITGEGQVITLNKTAELEFVKPPLPMGNSEQVQYSGKNLIPMINQEVTISGITFKAINGRLIINGTATNDITGNSFINNNFIFHLNVGNYVLSRTNVNSNLTINLMASDTQLISRLVRSDTNLTASFNVTVEKDVYIGFYIPQNSSFSNYECGVMVSTDGGTYEPYVGGTASPNPDYPQEITNVTGDVEVVVENKNLYDYNKVTRHAYYEINLTTNILSLRSYSNAFCQKIIANEGEKFRFDIKNNYTNSLSLYIFACDKNMKKTDYYYWGDTVSSGNERGKSFTVPKDTKYLLISILNFPDDLNIKDYLEIQLEKGTTKTDYVEGKSQTFTFPLGNEKLMLGDYLADDGIHHVREQATESGTAITLNDAKSGGAYLCNKKTSGNLVGKTLTFDEAITDVLIEYELEEEVIVPYTSAQQTVYNAIKQALSYEGQTNISSNQNAIFNVEAYLDTKEVLDNKVDKITGKGLSTNDFTNTYKNNVDSNTSARHTHTNKTVLDGIASSDITNWNGKQNETDNSLNTTNKTITGAINEVNSIAKGANQALSYGNYSTMITAFNALANDIYNVGQNVMIVTLEVPDLWISGIESTSVPYTYTTDEAFTTALSTNGYVQVGYYKLSALETQKVDLTDYEQNTNKTTTISSSSTNTQYPSAKAVYDYIQSLDGDEVSY